MSLTGRDGWPGGFRAGLAKGRRQNIPKGAKGTAVAAPVVVFGEALVDVYSRGFEQQQDGRRTFRFEGVMGGAPTNVAVHLAHGGQPVSLVAGFADDPLGADLRRFLAEWGIDLRYSVVHERSSTPLAMVALGPAGERTFRLYLRGTAAEQMSPGDLHPDVGRDAEWFHFGSVLLSFPRTQAVTEELLRRCGQAGAIVSYDINVRADVWAGGAADPRAMLDVLPQVDVLKISDEDMALLASLGVAELEHPKALFRYGCRLIAYTQGPAGAAILTPTAAVAIPAPQVDVVDTTGAGDAFMAGLITALRAHGLRRRADWPAEISPVVLQVVGEAASRTAASVLTHHGALPRRPQRLV